MVGKITVRLTSENQNIPLKEIVQFRDSESTLQITNIPDIVGKWNVKKVFVKFAYPDNKIETIIATKVTDDYVVSIPPCDIVGGGRYLIGAEVITETGLIVDDFTLGVGDIKIVDDELTPIPETTKYRMNFVENISCETKGNFYADEISACVYDGNKWINIKNEQQSLSGYATKDDLSSLSVQIENYIPTKVSQLSNDVGYLSAHQSLAGYATEIWVEGKNYLTCHQSLSSYYSKTDLSVVNLSGEFDDEIGGTFSLSILTLI